MFNTGVTMSGLENEVIDMEETTLMMKSDSIITYLAENHIPYSILNGAVYSALAKRDLRKALALARIQALYNPSDPNVWDTFGEVYYFLGETKLARKYELQSARINKDFKGGEEVWKKELEGFQKKWGGG
jgi:tetratricopeptide (TPR) repeat protein